MEDIKHLLSESATWETSSSFVDGEGNVSSGKGESQIIIAEDHILNQSWAITGKRKLVNNYTIRLISPTRYQYQSDNPDLGIQKGFFDINGNKVFSKFRIDNTDLNGYEIISREGNTCHASGALYKNDELINTWTALMILKDF